MGGVIYADSADKAARFIMDCNQTNLPIIFFQDVSGFMVGRDAEESGIIRSGAKLVNAVSNSVVPKITVIVGDRLAQAITRCAARRMIRDSSLPGRMRAMR